MFSIGADRKCACTVKSIHTVEAVLEQLALGEAVGIDDHQGILDRVDAVDVTPIGTDSDGLKTGEIRVYPEIRP